MRPCFHLFLFALWIMPTASSWATSESKQTMQTSQPLTRSIAKRRATRYRRARKSSSKSRHSQVSQNFLAPRLGLDLAVIGRRDVIDAQVLGYRLSLGARVSGSFHLDGPFHMKTSLGFFKASDDFQSQSSQSLIRNNLQQWEAGVVFQWIPSMGQNSYMTFGLSHRLEWLRGQTTVLTNQSPTDISAFRLSVGPQLGFVVPLSSQLEWTVDTEFLMDYSDLFSFRPHLSTGLRLLLF